MTSKLDQIEARLKAFFEKSAKLTPQHQQQLQLAEQLVSAMRSSIKQTSEGALTAPGSYLIRMYPEALTDWKSDPQLENALTRVLQEAAQEANIRFQTPLVIRITSDPELAPSAVQVSIENPAEKLGETAAMPLKEGSMGKSDTVRQFTAFLILKGKCVIPLTESVINLGRMLDNQVALEDPRVSRRHAQLRAMKNHYVLFDLNSTGGTYVNGQRIQQATLKPGDVISLAGVPLIYGEDSGMAPSIDQTGVILPLNDDKQTLTGKGNLS
ncbi:MAG: FHA domain-containing protein [Anaerolineaceae bacterium]|nr:FHA domain-containing protein [Anaerolineaceae bacterium]